MALAISVLMPIRNADRYLPEALDSLFAQSLREWELVAVLDRCTDRSLAILEEIRDSRIRIVDAPPPGGIATALNHGLALCKADYVARLDADDICNPRRLELQARSLERRPAIAALGSGAILIDERSQPIGVRSVVTGPRQVRRRLLWRNALIHPSVMFRRAVVVSLGGYKQISKGQDYELWLRVAAYSDVDNLAEPLLFYRLHRDQHSRGYGGSDIRHHALLSARIAAARRAGVTPLGAMARHVVWTAAQYKRNLRGRH